MIQIYQNAGIKILERVKSRTSFPGCHKHRIKPGYLGGTYDANNVLFLTQYEHALIHFIMWKLKHDTRDKRAYKMIGIGPAGLSHNDRVDHGLRCVEDKIGFHSASIENLKIWRDKGRETQRRNADELGDKNWYYWSTEVGRRERASMGGRASYGKNPVFKKQQGSFKDRSHAVAAAKKSAKKPVTDGYGVMLKFHTEEERKQFLIINTTWRAGCPTKKEKLLSVK
jgi:hypothetical protein